MVEKTIEELIEEIFQDSYFPKSVNEAVSYVPKKFNPLDNHEKKKKGWKFKDMFGTVVASGILLAVGGGACYGIYGLGSYGFRKIFEKEESVEEKVASIERRIKENKEKMVELSLKEYGIVKGLIRISGETDMSKMMAVLGDRVVGAEKAELVEEISKRFNPGDGENRYGSVFLNYLMGDCPEDEITIHVQHWKETPYGLGWGLKNKKLVVHGNAGDYFLANARGCNAIVHGGVGTNALYYANNCNLNVGTGVTSIDDLIKNKSFGHVDTMAGWYAESCTINAHIFDSNTGSNAKNSTFNGTRFGSNMGVLAENCKFYSKEPISISGDVKRGCRFYVRGELVKSTD